MKNIVNAAVVADLCGGELISTKKQLENGTFMFTFPQKPGKKYGVYRSGTVRCLWKGPYSIGMTPIIWDSFTDKRGYQSKKIRKVTLEEGLAYLLKRFKN